MADEVLRLKLSAGNYDVDTVGLSASDVAACEDLRDVVSLAGGCSLDMHPGKKNWVESAGGLPEYICEIARAILRDGKMSVSRAIATAVSRVKVWAAGGGGVDAETKAKAAAAVAQWEKIKSKSGKK